MKSSLHNKCVKEGAAKAHYHLNLNLDELNGRYRPYYTTFAGRGEGGITRMIPLAPAGIPIGIHPDYQISRQDSYWNPSGYSGAITREKAAEMLLFQPGKFC